MWERLMEGKEDGMVNGDERGEAERLWHETICRD